MPQLNDFKCFGRLGRDPELRTTNSGASVVDFSLAITKSKKVNGQWQEKTTWVDVNIWGNSSNRVMEKCKKGTEVFVQGYLDMDQWNDQNTGKKRTKHKITAFSVSPISNIREGKQQQQDGGGQMDAGEYAQQRSGEYSDRPFPKKKEEEDKPFNLDDLPF